MSEDGGELDLERGDEERAEKIADRQKGETPKRTRRTREPGKTTPRPSARQQIEAEIHSRLLRTFARISEAVGARGDSELATLITEDSEAMSQGIVSLTRTVRWLRGPLLMFLNLIEPILAFGRVGRVLAWRWMARRERIAAERAAAMETEPPVYSPEPVMVQ